MSTRTLRWVVIGTLLLCVLLIVTACGGQENNDAEKGSNDTTPADIIAFPDGFSNVAHKCDGPNMVYSSTNGLSYSGSGEANRTSISTVKDDPRCLAKWKDKPAQ